VNLSFYFVVPLDTKRNPLKLIIVTLLTACLLFASCRKEDAVRVIAEPCELQGDNPSGRMYESDSVVAFVCLSKHCGILPLSIKNYWIYEDSLFNDGVFVRIQYDTLRYSSTIKSLSDGLVWWESNITVGLPATLYANDSSLFSISDRMFTPGIKDARKDYSLFPGDSLRYLANFEDAAAMGRSLKMSTDLNSPAGTFSDWVYFEKNARNYRKDQVYFKPGIGVIKYIQEKAPMGTFILKLQQVSTLVAYHIE
jgi:hypothetical protein